MESYRQTERRLKRAVEASTPDVLQDILRRVEQEKPEPPTVVEFPPVAKNGAWRKWAACAAAMALLVAGLFLYNYYTPISIIGLDVNPSIELKINRMERILSATPLNPEGELVLSDMRLQNTDLNVAVNALIGSMVQNGYISEMKNSILITVDSSDSQKGQELQQRLSENVGSMLTGNYSVEGAVLSQTVCEDERLQTLAESHGISLGKAALVDLLVSQDETLTFSGVAALSINDINLLIASRQTNLQGVSASGQASNGAYIGEDTAKALALTHAGVDEASLLSMKIEMDYDDGHMVYELEFSSHGANYEYDLDALTGDVLEYERQSIKEEDSTPAQGTDSPEVNPPPASQPDSFTGQIISGEQAMNIALDHAGISRNDAEKLEVKLDEDDDRYIYEVEFEFGDTDYEYEIDAETGRILWWEAD